jgi:nucleoside-diphosphate-sugar epimerase
VNAVDVILSAARKHGVERTVHCSTVGVHGHVNKIPSNEESEFNPGDIYQETKLEGENRAKMAIERGEPVSIVRPAGIYGPGDFRFLKLFSAIRKGRFVMFGSGETLYHFTYIDDLVNGIILCGEHPSAVGEVFIICGDEYVTLNNLVGDVAEAVSARHSRLHVPLWPLFTAAKACEWICKPFGLEPPLYTRRCEFFVKNRAFSNEKARRLLDFKPKFNLKRGIATTAQWYLQKGLLAIAVAPVEWIGFATFG